MSEDQQSEVPIQRDSIWDQQVVITRAEISAELVAIAGSMGVDVSDLLPGMNEEPMPELPGGFGFPLLTDAEHQIKRRRMEAQVERHPPESGQVVSDTVIIEKLGQKPSSRSDATKLQDREYLLRYTVCPELPPIDLGQLKLTRRTYQLTDESIEQWALAKYQSMRGPLFGPPEQGRVATLGDAVTITFEKHEGDKQTEGLKRSTTVVRAGMTPYDVYLSLGLIGLKAGDRIRYTRVLPLSLVDEQFDGRAVEYVVKVREVQPMIPAVLNDQLATAAGFASVAQFRQQAKLNAENYVRKRARRELHVELGNALVAANTVELPATAVWESAVGAARSRRQDPKEELQVTHHDLEQAERTLRTYTAQRTLVHRLNIRPTEAQLARAVMGWGSESHPNREQREQFRAMCEHESGLREHAQSLAESEMLLDMVLEQCEVINESVDLATVIGDEFDLALRDQGPFG